MIEPEPSASPVERPGPTDFYSASVKHEARKAAEAGMVLPAIPGKYGWVRRLFAFHNHSPEFFRKLRF